MEVFRTCALNLVGSEKTCRQVELRVKLLKSTEERRKEGEEKYVCVGEKCRELHKAEKGVLEREDTKIKNHHHHHHHHQKPKTPRAGDIT